MFNEKKKTCNNAVLMLNKNVIRKSFPNFTMKSYLIHWLGAYRTNALYSGHIFVRFNDLEDVFT